MNEFTHVILDDVHERDQETDFCLLLVKLLKHKNSKDVKIILMSTTADSEKLSYYMSVKKPAPILRLKAPQPYDVQEIYLDQLCGLGQQVWKLIQIFTIVIESIKL